MRCAAAVADGISYGIVTGFVIGATCGAVYGKIMRVRFLGPFIMQNGVGNAIFGGTFFGALMAYRYCF